MFRHHLPDMAVRYGAVLCGIGAIAVAHFLVEGGHDPTLTHSGFLVVVVLAAWLAGRGPALAGLTLGLLALLGAAATTESLQKVMVAGAAYCGAGLVGIVAMGAIRRSAAGARLEADNAHRHLEDMEKRHDELRTTLRRIEKVVEQGHRRRNEFLAMLAHELRNPLAPIRNALYVLARPGTSQGTLVKLHDMLDRQVRQLTHLVDDLLDVTRMHGGKLELRKELVNFDVVVQRTLDFLRPLLEDRCLELIIALPEESLVLEADPTRLEQVLVNLLHNAIKYTDPGGRVWLEAAPRGDVIEVRVRDSGIGIAPEMLPDLFDLFVQMERRLYRSQGGLGIGLTLVRNLVELHGGTVQAHSSGLGQGSEFIVRLPVRQAPPAPASIRSPRAEGESMDPKHSLLVVDDNVDAADSLALLLRLEGHEVRVAHDGPSALKIAQAERPHMIFLDLGMPGMDGYQVARRLRRLPEFQQVLLVALTGWGQEEDQRRSREAGFDLHLVKPVEPDELKELLAHPPRRAALQAAVAEPVGDV
ncbi:hypothetical protein AYO40_00090 [Planctomycetaceae bacterium SCGC AG-212-D15]|nr:hypothetical protein AYO40_00090 [Planctomycetaceae bacterium SCGC AG-212-D15]